MNINRKIIYIAALTALGLTACGGGGSGDSSSGTGSQANTVTGVITGFGSVFVDGVKYETDNASFNVDGVSASEDDLAVGMVVTLTGTVNADGSTGFANSIVFEHEVEGVVIANNYLSDQTLDIMGQTIIVDDSTIFESKIAGVTTIDQIAVDNIVEVSGYPTGNGTIHATRLEVKKQSKEIDDTLEVKGVVSNLDTSAQTFTLGSLTVDYSTAILDDITNLSDGLYVEVESTQALNGTTLIASEIELEDDGAMDYSGDDGEEMEFEGIVASVGDDNSFVVNGQTVHYNNATEFEYGDLSDLVVDTKVKVEGEFNADGNLIAEEIKFKVHGELEVSGLIDSIDTENGTFNMMGNTFHINNHTIMLDEQDEFVTPERYFNIDDLSSNEWVEVHFYQDGDGNLVATKFERDDYDDSDDDYWSVEGLISAIDTDTDVMVVAGVTVDFSAFPSFNANIGTEVEVDGSYNNGVFIATEIELEDDDD